MDPLAPARTVFETERICDEVTAAAVAALTPPRGPRFLDFPIDILYGTTEFEAKAFAIEKTDPQDAETVARLIESSKRSIFADHVVRFSTSLPRQSTAKAQVCLSKSAGSRRASLIVRLDLLILPPLVLVFHRLGKPTLQHLRNPPLLG